MLLNWKSLEKQNPPIESNKENLLLPMAQFPVTIYPLHGTVCLFVCFHTRSPGVGIIGSQGESQGILVKYHVF